MEGSSDVQNQFAGPGFRILYTLITSLSLGFTLSSGNGLFVGLLVMSIGLAADYLKFTPKLKCRIWSKNIGFYFNLGVVVLCVLALWGGATINYDFNLPTSSPNHLVLAKHASIDDYSDPSHLYLLITKISPFGIGNSFPVRMFWSLVCGLCTILTIVDRFTEKRELENYLTTSGNAQAAPTKED